eukprot:GHVQ01011405.1.p1 GENE.GHVQ01011405.1~~GHVQ01011405.1.p1  ORF type:complete len:498 (+),score=43.29 GHVQ01011405.1:210-1703(+)
MCPPLSLFEESVLHASASSRADPCVTPDSEGSHRSSESVAAAIPSSSYYSPATTTSSLSYSCSGLSSSDTLRYSVPTCVPADACGSRLKLRNLEEILSVQKLRCIGEQTSSAAVMRGQQLVSVAGNITEKLNKGLKQHAEKLVPEEVVMQRKFRKDLKQSEIRKSQSRGYANREDNSGSRANSKNKTACGMSDGLGTEQERDSRLLRGTEVWLVNGSGSFTTIPARRSRSHSVCSTRRSTELDTAMDMLEIRTLEQKAKRPNYVRQAQSLVYSPAAQIGMAVVIVCYCVMLGASTYGSKISNESAKAVALLTFFVLQIVFSVLFFVEMILKLLVDRSLYFKQKINCLDFVLSLLGAVDPCVLLAEAVGAVPPEVGEATSIIKLFQCFRLCRLLHLLKVVRTVQILVEGLASSFLSLVWAALVVLVVLYGGGIFATMYFGQEVELQHYWGDLFTAMYTLFTVVTLSGESESVATVLDSLCRLIIFFCLAFPPTCNSVM